MNVEILWMVICGFIKGILGVYCRVFKMDRELNRELMNYKE